MRLSDEEIARLEPWDPSDPFEAMAESFKRQVVLMVSEALDAAIFRDLPPGAQIQAVIAGVSTGLLGACFIYCGKDQRDAFVEAVVDYLPHARAQAEAMVDATDPGRAALEEAGNPDQPVRDAYKFPLAKPEER